MKRPLSIAVFCGSSYGTSETFSHHAYDLGKKMALRKIDVIYGGTNIGLMDDLANGVIRHGGRITGVITSQFQQQDISRKDLYKLHVAKSMSSRKSQMYALCDAAIAIPGGFGTLDEAFEMITLSQIGFHKKSIGFLNVAGFYDSLHIFVDTMKINGFISEESASLILWEDDINRILDKLVLGVEENRI